MRNQIKYRLVLKDGAVELEMLDCSGPICGPNSESVLRFIGLDGEATIAETLKSEFSRADVDAATATAQAVADAGAAL